MREMSMKEVKKYEEKKNYTKKLLLGDKVKLFNKDLYDLIYFFKSFCTGQEYGVLLEEYSMYKIGLDCEKVSSTEGKGDFKLDEKYIETKGTIIGEYGKKPKFNFVQIRLHQDIDFYLFIAYDIREEKVKEYLYLLTKKEMEIEVKIKGHLAHGLKRDKKDKDDNEYAIRFSPEESNEDFKRWNKKYLKKSFKEVREEIEFSNIKQ